MIRRHATRLVLAACTASALAFGAAQALAAPAPAVPGERVCSDYSCNLSCQRKYGTPGSCYYGVCTCWQT
jgi:hypothetical protein